MTRKKAVLAGIVILGLGLGWMVGGMLVSDEPQPLAASEIGSLPAGEQDASGPEQDSSSEPAGGSQGQPVQPHPEQPQPQPEQPEEPEPADEDADDDGVEDDSDNCPQTPNADQLNFDGDSMGDACDPDDDNDGLLDNDEASHGTNPFKKDTDGDGWSDGWEVKWSYDPLDPDSHPNPQLKL